MKSYIEACKQIENLGKEYKKKFQAQCRENNRAQPEGKSSLDFDVERLELVECNKRVLAEDVVTPIASPPFTNSAMDGFAVVYLEAQSSESLFVGETIFAKPLEQMPAKRKGFCVPIMTGAPVPSWADTVVPVENCQIFPKNSSDEHDRVVFNSLPEAGSHIRRQAEDVAEGSILMRAGTYLDSERVMVAASFGLDSLKVYKKPHVGIFTTGDELAMPGDSLRPGEIYNSSRFFLQAAFDNLGLIPDFNRVLRDSPETAVEEVETFLKSTEQDASLIVTTGAVSAGEKDFVPNLALDLGFDVVFHKVAIRPGKPIFFAQKENKLWVGLAGNAVSTMVGFHFFLRPILDAFFSIKDNSYSQVVLANEVKKPEHLRCFYRALVNFNDGSAHVYSKQGSASVEASTQANAYVVLPEGASVFEPGITLRAKLL